MSTVQLARYPMAPTVTRRKGTLLDAVNTIGNEIAWMDGVGLFESYNCMRFDGSAVVCGANSKDLDHQAGWVDGYLFAAYGGATCKAVGLDQGAMKAGLRDAFETGESGAVERALMAVLFAANDATATLPGQWAAAVDITPTGGAVKHSVGVAMLEEYAASVYTGVPTLHLPIAVASREAAVGALSGDGNKLFTKLGSKVVAGAGYAYPNLSPAGVAAAEGERWVYASGEIMLARSAEVIEKQVVDLENNDVLALIERVYLAAIDCFSVAVRVDIEA